MSVTFTVKCTECRRKAPELGVEGLMGFPSLSIDKAPPSKGRRPSPPEYFGYLYEGFRRVGLVTRPLDSYLMFLYSHVGHDVLVECDGEDAFDGMADLPRQLEAREATNGPPKPPRDTAYEEAHFRVECSKCSEVLESTYREPVRVGSPRNLDKNDIADFLERVIDPYDSYHGSEPFDHSDMQKLGRFLKKHRVHGPRLTLVPCDQDRHPHP